MRKYFEENFGTMDTIDKFTKLIEERIMLESLSLESPHINASKILLDAIIEEFCHMVKYLF